jgi:hypothetical protein
MGPPGLFSRKEKPTRGTRLAGVLPLEYVVVGGRLTINPKPVNENVEHFSPLKTPVEINKDQRFSLTAKRLADTFNQQIPLQETL